MENFKKKVGINLSIVEPIFWKYLTVDSEGLVNGIRDDAPEEMKEAYRKYLDQEAENEKRGIKT